MTTSAAPGRRFLPGPLSFRTELSLLLVGLVLLATVSLGFIAFTDSRAIIEAGLVREVGITANAREQALLTVFTEQKARATALLKTASLGCAPEETSCLRKVLNDFVATGGATAARLVYQRRRPIVVSSGGASLASVAVPADDQLARFDFDDKGQPYYVMVARTSSEDGELVVTLRGDMRPVGRIFGDRYGLGQSGETYLTDANGKFLTQPRNHGESGGRPLTAPTENLCSTILDGEVLHQDYRGVDVIHGLRSLGELGGACVVTQIDQAEAFSPTTALRRRAAGAFGLLAVVAMACSLLFAQLLSRPLNQLSHRARLLQAGDYDSAVPVGGPAEVQTFARTFEAMAGSLKESRLALLKSTDQISNILESISESFFALDREWTCTYVNEKAVAMMRVPREQLLGRKLDEIVPPAMGAHVGQELRRAAAEHVAVHFEQYHAPLDAWFEISAYPSREGLAVFGRDVTERKRFQERLQQTQKLESLGLLAGGIAHDFNNLLTGIIGNTSVLLEDVAPDSSMRAGLQDVENAAIRAAALTEQLLAYAGKARFVVEHLDLSALVREISNMIKTSIPKAVKVRLHLEAELPVIEGDVSQIQQLVMNLVINGAEAIGEGKEGAVVVTTRVQSVDERYIQQTLNAGEISPGEYVVLDVTDTGSGMSEETIARIFDPFYTTKFAGRGLGLAAAMGIVRGHQGALKVYSVPGEGSSFQVIFPVSSGQAAERRSDLEEKKLKGRGTILVIDDEEIVRRTARAALEHYGYRVIVAENGTDGLNLLRNGETIHLVLLDMTMPMMSGEETLKYLRQLRPDLPVILSSGFNQAEVTRTISDRALDWFIQKPYFAWHLAEQVKIALRRADRQGGAHA